MMSFKNEHVLIRDLSDLSSQSIIDAWWASVTVDFKWPIAWNNTRHVRSWRFDLHSGNEDTGSLAIVSYVSHQVLRDASEHGICSTGKHLLSKAHIPKLNQLTVSEVTELTCSMVDETALAILKWQGSWGFTIRSSQRTMISDIDVNAD
jgi:hypothetical protein